MSDKLRQATPKVDIRPLTGSTMLKEIMWTANTLFVTFKNGDIWRVAEFQYEQFLDFAAAESAGKYYNTHIRGSNEVCAMKRSS